MVRVNLLYPPTFASRVTTTAIVPSDIRDIPLPAALLKNNPRPQNSASLVSSSGSQGGIPHPPQTPKSRPSSWNGSLLPLLLTSLAVLTGMRHSSRIVELAERFIPKGKGLARERPGSMPIRSPGDPTAHNQGQYGLQLSIPGFISRKTGEGSTLYIPIGGTGSLAPGIRNSGLTSIERRGNSGVKTQEGSSCESVNKTSTRQVRNNDGTLPEGVDLKLSHLLSEATVVSQQTDPQKDSLSVKDDISQAA